MDQEHTATGHPVLATHRDPSLRRSRIAARGQRGGYGIEWVSVSELGTRASTRVIAVAARGNLAAAQRTRTAIAERLRRLAPLSAFGHSTARSSQGHTRSL